MKLTVKTLKGSHFEIDVHPNDTIMAVKKNIEEMQGKDTYPWGQQLLIHNGKVLKDESTLDQNKVSENGFLVVMLSKSKTCGATGTSSHQPLTTASTTCARHQQLPLVAPSALEKKSDANGQAAPNLSTGGNVEQMIQQLISMGSGNWDRDTVLRALHAAYNNPERAVEYLYSGIPEATDVAAPGTHFPSSELHDHARTATEESAPVSGIPNSSPLNMFPQGTNDLEGDFGHGALDFLRESSQFQRLRGMIQANPQIILPMLEELGKQNPQLLRIVQEHYNEFLQLLGVVDEGAERDAFDSEPEMTHPIGVTQEEQDAIERLEAMGFDRELVIEAFLACDRNEELAANYLLEQSSEDD